MYYSNNIYTRESSGSTLICVAQAENCGWGLLTEMDRLHPDGWEFEQSWCLEDYEYHQLEQEFEGQMEPVQLPKLSGWNDQ